MTTIHRDCAMYFSITVFLTTRKPKMTGWNMHHEWVDVFPIENWGFSYWKLGIFLLKLGVFLLKTGDLPFYIADWKRPQEYQVMRGSWPGISSTRYYPPVESIPMRGMFYPDDFYRLICFSWKILVNSFSVLWSAWFKLTLKHEELEEWEPNESRH